MQKWIRVRVKSTDEMFQIAIRDSADITRLARRFIGYGVLMIHRIRRLDHGSVFFLRLYGKRYENVIQYDTKAQIDDNDSVPSRISCVTKLRSFNRHQTWQPVRNTVHMSCVCVCVCATTRRDIHAFSTNATDLCRRETYQRRFSLIGYQYLV